MRSKHEAEPPAEFVYRFDVWVSLNDKHGKKVDRMKFLILESELYDKFGGLTCTPIVGTPIYEGFWKDPETEEQMRDMNTIYTVLGPRTAACYEYFAESRTRWQTHFNQKSILITAYQVEVL